MRVRRLTIEHFRGINHAELHFDDHALLIGGNNVGKSTVCEALDFVLGPDRLRKLPPVEEFDFYNGEYFAPEDEPPIRARVEALLTDLTPEVTRICASHLEFWHIGERRLLGEGEVDRSIPSEVVPCLRLETVAVYNREEDEFEADTYFGHGTTNQDDSPQRVPKHVKRLCGFLYLRALRTGSRALSLERGSLLDVILRMQGVKTGLWEASIRRLRELDPPIADQAPELAPILDNIEKRLAEYIQLNIQERATSLYVSKLTREHLRETISFFLSTTPGQKPVPFEEAGTGTLNTLVLALLSFIAEVKRDNVIFAMEEPEVALPPHTQRRIAKYLLTETAQCFVTTHSPYVIERFNPDHVHILKRDEMGNVTATEIALGSTLKEKMYRRHMRRGLAEAMLGQAVIVVEGISEQTALAAVAEKMESIAPDDCYPLDLSGVTIFPVEGDGMLPPFGSFFKSVGLKTYAFYDKKARSAAEEQKLKDAFDSSNETLYTGIEKLLASEVPASRLWQFLEVVRDLGEQPHLGVPTTRPDDNAVKELATRALKCNKGSSYVADLIRACDENELPVSITSLLTDVFAAFRKPEHIPIPVSAPTNAVSPQNQTGETTNQQ